MPAPAQETKPTPVPPARVQEIPIKPLVVQLPGERIVERYFQPVERHTDALPVVPQVHIEVPTQPAPHITVNVSERSKDESERVRGNDTPTHGTPYPEKERGASPEVDVSPAVEEPTEQAEPKSLTPVEAEKRSGEEPKEVNTPPPALKPEIKKRANGKPGRKNTELQHAINWILWEQTSFDKKRCPWKNPYECKKHQPPDENLIEARRLLGFDF